MDGEANRRMSRVESLAKPIRSAMIVPQRAVRLNRDQQTIVAASALFSVSIEKSPHTLAGTLPNGVGQGGRRGLATETHGFPQTVHQGRTARTVLAVPFNGIARRCIELPVQVP
jgi:hypothetical protein